MRNHFVVIIISLVFIFVEVDLVYFICNFCKSSALIRLSVLLHLVFNFKHLYILHILSQIYIISVINFFFSEPDEMKSMQQLAVYVRRWWPSTYTLDAFQEIVLSTQSLEELKQKVMYLVKLMKNLSKC